MKNIICLCAITLLAASTLFAQDASVTKENVSKNLCKIWKLDHLITDGMQIAPKPGATWNYEFRSDYTFIMSGGGSVTKGTWSYDPAKKLIRLKINNISNTEITSLNEDELKMFADMKSATPSDPTGITMFFVPLN